MRVPLHKNVKFSALLLLYMATFQGASLAFAGNQVVVEGGCSGLVFGMPQAIPRIRTVVKTSRTFCGSSTAVKVTWYTLDGFMIPVSVRLATYFIVYYTGSVLLEVRFTLRLNPGTINHVAVTIHLRVVAVAREIHPHRT